MFFRKAFMAALVASLASYSMPNSVPAESLQGSVENKVLSGQTTESPLPKYGPAESDIFWYSKSTSPEARQFYKNALYKTNCDLSCIFSSHTGTHKGMQIVQIVFDSTGRAISARVLYSTLSTRFEKGLAEIKNIHLPLYENNTLDKYNKRPTSNIIANAYFYAGSKPNALNLTSTGFPDLQPPKGYGLIITTGSGSTALEYKND